MPAPDAIRLLVERFEQHRAAYLAGTYNEAQLRLEFLDPFFAALGWDVYNRQGYAEAYKDVIHEDAIRVSGAVKAPDYAFRIGGTRKFFVEAKKPAVNIKEQVQPAFQLRRYAWSARLPLSILTDFEEFAVYDCRSKPDQSDKASTGRIWMLTYRDYLEKWEQIAATFSRDAVLRGAFDQYAESSKAKHGTAEVDQAFLAEIEGWRDLLARNLALRNPALSSRELNYAVQMTIDRIVFLRICEDRGIEFYGGLQALTNGKEVYPRLLEIFRKADERYNSGLFHFHDEKGQTGAPDRLTPGLGIDDKTLKEIIAGLYYPASPYEFSVLPADILGQVYEQFLGKVIRLTAGHHAVVEDKPEVKKAGGVFYTPTYIVEYIVRQTVGERLAGKRPGDVGVGKGSPLRIADPACGSGSFLLGAYQYLLDWYRDGYVAQGPEKWAKGSQPRLVQVGGGAGSTGGDWKLTTAERKRILLDHLYGVDIDPQAVEVTKLSLLLKVLEGENERSLAQQLSLWQERVLPDLGRNIQCGNSLIGPDFYQGKQASFLDMEEQYRINVFDWQAAFPQVFKAESHPAGGGFDVVIGNPPYIRIQALKEWAPREVEFYKQRYTSASKGNYDIYVVFVERCLGLLNKNGRLGFILPHKFFNAQYGQPLREQLASGRYLAKIVHFGDQQVFSNATTYTCLMFLDKAGCEQFEIEKVDDLRAWRLSDKGIQGSIPAANVSAAEWNFSVGKGAGLYEKLRRMPVKLEDVTSRIFQGIKTSADKIYIVEELERESGRVKVFSREREAEFWLEPVLLHLLIKGGDSRRYNLTRTKRLIIFPYRKEDEKTELIPESIFKSQYPLTWGYLTENKNYLVNREDGKMNTRGWYGYGRVQALDVMHLPKLFTPDIAARSSFSLDETGEAFFTGGVAGGYGILVLPEYSREYILGLLNSRLLEWYLRQVATQMRGGYYSYESRFIRGLPIAIKDIEAQESLNISSLVESMLSLHRQLAAAQTPHEQAALKRMVEATDHEIDGLVYQLYGLTEEEIRIVEGQ
jgi:predicted type IV restriction endonuclease